MRPLTFQVLKLIADGGFHSGAAIARRLAVTRASVWHALNQAQALGRGVHRVHGRGYRLAEPLDWLDAQAVNARVAPLGLAVEVLDCCESTSTRLLADAAAGAASGRVVAAELQTAGRGRRGRVWRSGLARALTFSLLWRFSQGAAGLGGLSLAAGVGIARALERHGLRIGLKWPNDLVWSARKLGGILIEVTGDVLGPSAAVIGVGLNVRLQPDERRRIDQPAADLAQAGGAGVARTELLASLLAELDATLRCFATEGFAPFREPWRGCHVHEGRAVRVLLPDGGELRGTACGVDERGALRIDTMGEVRTVHSGEVSLRAADDPRG